MKDPTPPMFDAEETLIATDEPVAAADENEPVDTSSEDDRALDGSDAAPDSRGPVAAGSAPSDPFAATRPGFAEADAGGYDDLVDWELRLGREAGFFRKAFQSVNAVRVADVGCGTGRHAVMFASWGLDVVAIDPSSHMLDSAVEHARANADAIIGAGGHLEFVEAGFGDLSKVVAPDRVDVVVCTGNALPHVDGVEGLRAALEDFADALRAGGILILHFLNHTRLLQKKPAFLPPKSRITAEGRKLFIKLLDYPESGETIDFDFLTLSRPDGQEWSVTSRESLHTALPVDLMTHELSRAGFDVFETSGGHDGRRLELLDDESVVISARRRRHLP